MGDTKLCVSCMSQVPADSAFCPRCHYDGTQHNESFALPIGTRLNGRYVVGMLTDNDGLTLSYAGFDIQARCRVIIKEYMPVSASSRVGQSVIAARNAEVHFKNDMRDFEELYASLAALSDEPGLIAVRDVFKLNGTVYAVEESFGGVSLEAYMKMKGDTLDFERCDKLMTPIFAAVRRIHSANLLHRGISPQTIFLRSDGKIKLSGFACSAVRTVGTEYKSRLFDGYSAPEQYSANAFVGTAADVYSLAATIYTLFSAAVPQGAQQRKVSDNLSPLSQLVPDLPEGVSVVLSNAMIIDPKQRTSSVEQLSSGLRMISEEKENELAESERLDEEELRYDNRFRRARTSAIISACIMVLCAGIFFLWQVMLLDNEEPGGTVVVPEQKLYVPNFIGQNIFDDELSFDNSLLCEVRLEYNSGYGENVIFGMSPSPGSSISPGGTITLRVSMGARIIKMPNLKGLTAANATRVLNELAPNISHSFVYTYTDSAIPNLVVNQSVAPGAEFEVGAYEIVITIALPTDSQFVS